MGRMSNPIGFSTEKSPGCNEPTYGYLHKILFLGISIGAVLGIGLEGLRFVGGFLFIAAQVVASLLHFWEIPLGALVIFLGLLSTGIAQGVKRSHFLGLMPLLSNVIWMEWGSFWFCRGGGGDESLAVVVSNGFFILAVILSIAALVLQREGRLIVLGFLVIEVPIALACAFVVGMASSGTWL